MKTNNKILSVLTEQGLLPLYYHDDAAISIAVLKALYKSGIRAVEYTHRGAKASQNFAKMMEVKNQMMPDLYLGIGTVKDLNQAQDYITLGADFVISPGFVPEIATYLKGEGILYSPGCMTPTEIGAAERAGVELIKLFPGNCIGPSFLMAVKGLFPDLHFMPTGGVTPGQANLEEWFHAGVVAVGMGSQLISTSLLEARDFDGLTKSTQTLLQQIRLIKNK